MLALLSTEAELALPVPSARAQYWAYARSEAPCTPRALRQDSHRRVPQPQTGNAQRLGDALGKLLKGVLDELNLTQDQQATAPVVVRKHLELCASHESMQLPPL